MRCFELPSVSSESLNVFLIFRGEPAEAICIIKDVIQYNKARGPNKSSSYAKLEYIGENYISKHGYINQPHGADGHLTGESLPRYPSTCPGGWTQQN